MKEITERPIGVKVLSWIIIVFAINEFITPMIPMLVYYGMSEVYLSKLLSNYSYTSSYVSNLYLGLNRALLKWELFFLRDILRAIPFILSTLSIYCILFLISAIGLLRFKNWARKLMLVCLSFLLLISMVTLIPIFIFLSIPCKFKEIDMFGTLLYLFKTLILLYPIIYLTRPKVKEQFK